MAEVETFIASFRLKSGGFESSIECPLDSTQTEREAFMLAWLAMIEAGLKVGTTTKLPAPPPGEG